MERCEAGSDLEDGQVIAAVPGDQDGVVLVISSGDVCHPLPGNAGEGTVK